MTVIDVFLCTPWDSYLTQLEEECMRAQAAHELELDLQREAELDPYEVTQVEYVEAALLYGIQRQAAT